jgi:hypothetical protein
MLIKLDRLILYRNGFWSAHERPTPKLENCLPAYATSISKVASAEDPGLMILSTPSANHAPVWRREERGVEARSTGRAGIVDLEACRETKFGIRLAAAYDRAECRRSPMGDTPDRRRDRRLLLPPHSRTK